MKRFGGKLIFCGIVLIIGPLFGFTIRGYQDLDFTGCFILGAISIIVGIIINSITNKKEE